MGNMLSSRITVEIKKREYKLIDVNIPYGQLQMIKVLQKEFDYEVKGTIYVDDDYNFKSFEVRTDNSEIYSYGASDWRVSFHTHPDNTAKKYGVRHFSPPSVDDVIEIYDHSISFAPDTTKRGFEEISIVFANEGIYTLQVNRKRFEEFNKDNLPIEGLEAILNGTLTDFLVSELKRHMKEINPNVNIEKPDITIEQYCNILKQLSIDTGNLYGFDMSFYSWKELEKTGLDLKVCDYFLNKKVED
jgi:hypothetical protein